jgi:hypothetical protein
MPSPGEARLSRHSDLMSGLPRPRRKGVITNRTGLYSHGRLKGAKRSAPAPIIKASGRETWGAVRLSGTRCPVKKRRPAAGPVAAVAEPSTRGQTPELLGRTITPILFPGGASCVGTAACSPSQKHHDNRRSRATLV